MLPSEKFELAVYKHVSALEPLVASVSLPQISQITGENDHGRTAERLTAMDADNLILLSKWVGGTQWPRTQFRNDTEFYHNGSFVVRIAPQGRKYFEELELRAEQEAKPMKVEDKPISARDVFVIHGRDERLRAGMFDFLKSLDLHPMEWEYAVKLTGTATPYVGQVLDAAFSHARAVVVLFTPDDVARLRPDLCGEREPEHETALTPQSRPNVLFEAGMAMARNAERTILVEIGALRPFSDAGGRHAIRMDNSVEKRKALALRLQNAGCAINLTGGWEKQGDLQPPKPWADPIPNQLLSLERSIAELQGEKSAMMSVMGQQNQKPTEPQPELRQVGAVNYYFVGDKGPYCQPCYDEKGRRIFLTPPQEWSGGIRRKCEVCNKFFYEKPMTDFTGPMYVR